MLTKKQGKILKNFIKEHNFDVYAARELHDNIKDKIDNFEINDFRFINEFEIDEIMQNDLKSNPYYIGCCASWLLADVLNISTKVVDDAKINESYEVIGEIIANDKNKLKMLQEEIASNDGYGQYFAHYDGYEIDDLIELNYYAFKIN